MSLPINKIKGYYRSNTRCLCSKKCYENLTERIPYISSNKDFKKASKEWSFIIGQKSNGEYLTTKNKDSIVKNDIVEDLCLCGMKITQCYYILNDVTKEVAQLGSNCINRINPELMKNYKESCKKKFNCHICDVNVKDRESHLLTKIHNKKLEIFKNERKSKIKNIVFMKFIAYIESFYVKGSCYCCGELMDARGHFESGMHFSNKRDFLIKIEDKIRPIINKKMNELKRQNFIKNSRKCKTSDCDNRIDLKEPEWKEYCIKCYVNYINSKKARAKINIYA